MRILIKSDIQGNSWEDQAFDMIEKRSSATVLQETGDKMCQTEEMRSHTHFAHGWAWLITMP